MLRRRFARAILVVTLAGASSSACLSTPCNCPNFYLADIVVPAALDVQVMASGAGCPGPTLCQAAAAEGVCTQWHVPLTHTGGCTVTAQAADGQQATLSVNVQTVDLGCCGTAYTTDPPGVFSSFPNFSVADAGTLDGG